jgi:hypothetical protein
MLDYQVYLLDEQGCVSQVPQVISCVGDDEATRRARQLQGHQAAEVWQEARLVIKLGPP